ncbi:hypothetical protein KAM334_33630 [Aeromonas caviae]|nr:hypothetical protein KAM334_33630 [Aeromonas caviae]
MLSLFHQNHTHSKATNVTYCFSLPYQPIVSKIINYPDPFLMRLCIFIIACRDIHKDQPGHFSYDVRHGYIKDSYVKDGRKYGAISAVYS